MTRQLFRSSTRTAAAVVAALAVVLLAVVVLRTPAGPASTAPAPTAEPSVAPTAAPSATTPQPTPAATTAAPAPSAAAYVNTTYGFSVTLPAPYRKSERLSLTNTGSQRPVAHDAFTARTDTDEAAHAGTPCQTACPVWNYVAVVSVNAGGGSQTPRQWYTAFSFAAGETIEDTTVDGHAAVKVTNGSRFPLQFVVKDGDRMFEIAYQIYPPDIAVPSGASRDKLDQILASFRFTR